MPEGQRYIQTPDGTYHQFPADATDAQITEALSSYAKPAATSAPATPQPSAWQQAMQQATAALTGISPQAQPATLQTLIGAGKSVLGTIEGGGKLIRSIPGVGPALAGMGGVDLPVSTQPANQDQAIGKTAGNIAQFFMPGTALGKLKTAAATGSGLLDALIGAGIEGASAGAIGSAQTGSVSQGAKIGATTAGAGLAMQGLMQAAKPLADKIETVLVKPSAADYADGFKAENIFKYDVGGSLSKSYDKIQTKLDNLSNQLKSALGANPSAEVDLGEIMQKTMQKASANASKTFGQNASIERAANLLEKEIPYVTSTGKVDLATANEVKQAAGKMGAWLHDPTGKVYGADDKALETLANGYYAELKTAIEQASGNAGRIKDINRQIGDLIPLNRAVIRRIPIDARNSVLSLGDLLSFSTKTWWLSALNRVMKSGPAAQGLNAIGENAPALAPAAGRAIGGGMVPIGGGGQ